MENNNVNIYALYDPISDTPKYIGKTINSLEFRLRKHIEKSIKNRKTIKDCWIISLVDKGLKPKIEIIDIVPQDEWQFWEKHYICLYKSWGFKLKNGTEGGDGTGKSYKHTQETLNKIFLKTSGDNHWMKRGLTVKFLQHLENLHRKIKGSHSNKKNKTLNEMYGCEKSLKIKMLLYKPILQFNIDGIFIKEWDCAKTVENELNIKRSNICKVLKGNRKKAGGFIWKYKN